MFLQMIPTGTNLYQSAGSIVHPTLTYNIGTNTVTVSAGTYRTFLTTNLSGQLVEFSIPERTIPIIPHTISYLVINYNDGEPLIYFVTDESLYNDSNLYVIYTCILEDEDLDYLDWDSEGLSLANKISTRLIDTLRFARVRGLELSSVNRVMTSAPGSLYVGINKLIFKECSSDVDKCVLMVKNALGDWDTSNITVYPNTKYDSNGSGLVDLTDNQWGSAFVWRCVGDPKKLYVAMGQDSYVTEELAKESKVPSDLSPSVALDATLIGQLVFLKGSTTATVRGAFDTIFGTSASTYHNALLGLQGGNAGTSEYFHMTSAKHIVIGNTSNTNTGDETQSTIVAKIGYTPESISNKAIVLTTSNDTLYPSVKAVNDGLATKEPVITKNTAFNKNYTTTTTDIKMNGSQSLGSLDTLAKSDHIHPSDTSREPVVTKGNLTAGSSKILIGGTGTNAVIGAGVTIDVSEVNLTHNNIGSLQGGNGSTEYYHTTSAEKSAITHTNRANLDTINQNLGTTSNVTFSNITSTGLNIESLGAIIPTSGNNHNVVLPDNTIILITNTPGNFTITGLTGGVNGRMVTLINLGTSNMTIASLNNGSLTENQIDCLAGNFATTQKGSVQLVYSTAVNKWLLVSSIA